VKTGEKGKHADWAADAKQTDKRRTSVHSFRDTNAVGEEVT